MFKFIKEESKIITIATSNAATRSSVAEHLVANNDCAKKYQISIFTITNHCNIFFDLVK